MLLQYKFCSRQHCKGKESVESVESGKKSGAYKLTCDMCKEVYIDQTGHNFITGCKFLRLGLITRKSPISLNIY